VRTLMRNVSWSLGVKKYKVYKKFVADVTEDNMALHPEGNEWEPDRIVSDNFIRVMCEAPWKRKDNILYLTIGEPDTPLTMGRLLFELNNATFEFFRHGDHHFFEGFGPMPTNSIAYPLYVGS
jgi:hypothetical protein